MEHLAPKGMEYTEEDSDDDDNEEKKQQFRKLK
jgi:hypothetical protein